MTLNQLQREYDHYGISLCKKSDYFLLGRFAKTIAGVCHITRKVYSLSDVEDIAGMVRQFDEEEAKHKAKVDIHAKCTGKKLNEMSFEDWELWSAAQDEADAVLEEARESLNLSPQEVRKGRQTGDFRHYIYDRFNGIEPPREYPG